VNIKHFKLQYWHNNLSAMNYKLKLLIVILLSNCFAITGFVACAQTIPGVTAAEILTPKAGPEPRINGPKIFGVRPGNPLIYTIPTTGERPIKFSVTGLPKGVKINQATGRLSGSIKTAGTYKLTLKAKNKFGESVREFKIIAGDTIALTPPMGWNSWNIYAGAVNQELVVANAKAMAESGLIDHGWSYINIDDVWQGKRGGKYNAIQPNPVTFPDMSKASKEIHELGLKLGIYSSPWMETYGRHIGGSSNVPQGAFDPTKEKVPHNINKAPYAIGKYHFAKQDARQWADWDMDYLKYDWNPNEVPETKEMYDALRESGRDIVFSLSNSTPFKNIGDLYHIANSWRTSGDIVDTWQSLKPRLFSQDKWAPFAGPGHWNDPDMMVVGIVGWGKDYHLTHLTPDEQYTHMSAWCLMSVPLLLGCDLTKLDEFTLSLLTNDEVIAVDQDPLGKQATIIWRQGDLFIMAKDMEDGSKAIGLFNAGNDGIQKIKFSLADLHLTGKFVIRDLWRQKDLGYCDNESEFSVPQHGVLLLSLRK
jgi:alpha-galactosidase